MIELSKYQKRRRTDLKEIVHILKSKVFVGSEINIDHNQINMYLLLNHTLRFKTSLSKNSLLARIERLQETNQNNRFNVNTFKYSISTHHDIDTILIWNRYSRSYHIMELSLIETNEGIIANIRIRPGKLNLVITFIITALIIASTVAISTKLIIVSGLYLSKIASLQFAARWSRDLFSKRILNQT